MNRHPGTVLRAALSFALVISLSVPTYAGAARPESETGGVTAAHRSRADLASSSGTSGRVLVAYKPGKRSEAVASAKSRGASLVSTSERSGFVVVKTPASTSDKAFAAQIAKQDGVKYAEPVYTRRAAFSFTATDTYYPMQWGLERVGAEAAWDVTRGASTVKVAVIDSGVDAGHPELASQVDTANDYDFVDDDAVANDANGHGTHVAGIIAAETDNATGVAGLANESTLLPVRVLDAAGNGDTPAIVNGIRWAADHGARVINMSLAGGDFSQAEYDAVQYARGKNVVVVAAAGNNADWPVSYPARYPGVIAVGSIDNADALSYFSNIGAQIDLVAPGEDILSTYPLALTSTAFGQNGYEMKSGTSMAAPHVAAAAALVAAKNTSWTPDQIEGTLKTTADDKGPAGRDSAFGWGVVRPDQALAAVAPSDLPSIGDDNIPG
ncbi:MAG TPA: S8 family peptidase, partial [Coriobacteriia bacterium]|nr:S8 family peptidase [Coriobacteriia bacterium]